MFQARVYDIGTRLKRARRAKKITQVDLARQLGFSPALISNIERGLLPHRLETLRDYARLVDVDIKAIEDDLAAVRAAVASVRLGVNDEARAQALNHADDTPKSEVA